MKKLRIIPLMLLSLSFLFLFVRCEKFKVLKDEDTDLVSAGENTKNATFAAFIRSDEYHQNDRYSQLKLYAQAIKMAGLEELLDNPDDNFTIVMFTDAAMNTLITDYGYNTLEEVPAAALRYFLLNNITAEGKYQVTDLSAGEDKILQSLTDEQIFFRRESTAANPYGLRIGKSQSSTGNVTVRSRDLPFKNAIGHVVTEPSFTTLSTTRPDERPGGLIVDKDSVFVEKDVLLQFASSQSGYTVTNPTGDNFQTKMGTTINNSNTRRLYLQYKLRQPTFGNRIGRAFLRIFHTRTANPGTVDSSHVYVYGDAYRDWAETITNFTDLPAIGDSIGSFKVRTSGENNKWFTANVTSAVVPAFDNNQDFVNIGVWSQSSPNIYFGHLGHANAATNKSYILFESPPASIVTGVTINPLVVNSVNFMATINKTNITAAGATDKNLTYYLVDEPVNGIIVVNGKPLKRRGIFTQEQLRQGVVKYLPTIGVSNTTDQVVLEIQDFQGGYYSNMITLPIQIN